MSEITSAAGWFDQFPEAPGWPAALLGVINEKLTPEGAAP